MVQLKELLYIANIIDYGRVITLYWALKSSDGYTFAFYYSISYLLDCVDGYAARALNQESRLGYYLDMVIDRISSCLCLHFAAQAVLAGNSCFGASTAPYVAFILRALIVLVEIVAHSAVMFLSEALGVHQKQMGYDYLIVRKYLSDKVYLFWACLSFELFGLGCFDQLAGLRLPSSSQHLPSGRHCLEAGEPEVEPNGGGTHFTRESPAGLIRQAWQPSSSESFQRTGCEAQKSQRVVYERDRKVGVQ
eukprot:TRINITY_DN7095_c0_g1_i1.p1 TRINITY_DN7095_c0_g1~~TRINITY_DN7095_c0_g1_i1.p1  ORF type:complete len:249 (-),score=33.76 TRINITY_DN7095_c0_g1_i1:112-858(-)